jgi:mannose-6-phosphate isomerase
MYPLKFKSIYVKKVWAGNKLKSIKKDITDNMKIGESWEVSCREKEINEIINGKYKSKTLREVINIEKEKLIGTKIDNDRFPLLLKYLDAFSELSIQVHPNDEYSGKYENDLGKTEAWVVLKADKDAYMILGTNDCTKGQLEKAIINNEISKYFIKSGLIHSMKGVLVLEIQQNSDVTYRIYDGDNGRDLHIKKALDVIDLGLKTEKSYGLSTETENYKKTYYCFDKNFALEKYIIKNKVEEESDLERFYLLTCIKGKGLIKFSSGSEEIVEGETIMIPADLGKFEISGKLEILKTYVPNIEKVEKEIISYVKK